MHGRGPGEFPDQQPERRQPADRRREEAERKPPSDRLAEQRVDPFGRDGAHPRRRALVEQQQCGRERRLLAATGPHRGAVRAQLGQVGIAIGQPPENGDEEQRIAEDAYARESEGVADAPVVMLMRQHGAQLGVREQLDGSLGHVDSGPQVAGAEGLRTAVGEHLDPAVLVESLDGPQPGDQPEVLPALSPARAGGQGDRERSKRGQRQQQQPGAVDGGIAEANTGEDDRATRRANGRVPRTPPWSLRYSQRSGRSRRAPAPARTPSGLRCHTRRARRCRDRRRCGSSWAICRAMWASATSPN